MKKNIRIKGKLKKIFSFEEKGNTEFGFLVLETENKRLFWIKTAGKTTEYLKKLNNNDYVEMYITLNNSEDIEDFPFFALFIKPLNINKN